MFAFSIGEGRRSQERSEREWTTKWWMRCVVRLVFPHPRFAEPACGWTSPLPGEGMGAPISRNQIMAGLCLSKILDRWNRQASSLQMLPASCSLLTSGALHQGLYCLKNNSIPATTDHRNGTTMTNSRPNCHSGGRIGRYLKER